MKYFSTLLVLTLLATASVSARTIDFEENTIAFGALGTFNAPTTAGTALHTTYPNTFYYWQTANNDLAVVNGIVRNNHLYNNVLEFVTSGSSIEIGPLLAGSCIFTLLTSNFGPATCQVTIYSSNHSLWGSPEFFTVDNGSANNYGVTFCSVNQQIPTGGFVKISMGNPTGYGFYIDDITDGGGPTPVELVSFSAFHRDKQIDLQWKTATEINNFGFEVERSVNREDWSEIGFVSGAGTSFSPKDYVFTDNEIDNSNGELFYRLRQVDRDGSTEYSDILRVALAPPATVELSAFPQPFAGTLNIDLSSKTSEQVSVTLYNSVMQKISSVYEGTVDGNMSMSVPTPNLRDGSYFLIVNHANGETQVQKLMHLQNR